MSDFHSITPYGSKVCHGSVTGVTGDTTVVGCDSICASACATSTCLFVYLCHWHMCCLFCLFVSPSGLIPLIDGQWTSTKSNCTHSIRRGLGRRLRSSLLLNSSPRCDLPCRIVY